jgi:hypothetical protein
VWFRQRVAGEDVPALHGGPGSSTDFEEGRIADAPREVDILREEWQRADDAVSELPLFHTFSFRDETWSLRMVYLHMIGEYACHNGHADLIREQIDGVTGKPPREQRSRLPCVVAGAEPIDHDHGFVTDDPGVVPARERGDVTGTGLEFAAVVHVDHEVPRYVILEVRSRTALGAGDRLHVRRPSPPGLEHEPADFGCPDLYDLGSAVGELPYLVRVGETAVLRYLSHDAPFALDAGILTY